MRILNWKINKKVLVAFCKETPDSPLGVTLFFFFIIILDLYKYST